MKVVTNLRIPQEHAILQGIGIARGGFRQAERLDNLDLAEVYAP
jgi:hypothetical protein